MEKGLDKFSIREVLIIILPGFYAVALASPLLKSYFSLSNSNDLIQSTIYIIASLSVGITLYFIDIPKRIWFFKKNIPTQILKNELPNLSQVELDIAFYSFYDGNNSEVQKNRTNVYTSFYHFSINIFIASIIISILFAITEDNYWTGYGLITGIIGVANLLNAIGIVYGKRKIKYMFERQLAKFKNSDEYQTLVTRHRTL